MATIAIVGAGPGLGLSIARRFGREGFHVGLIGISSGLPGAKEPKKTGGSNILRSTNEALRTAIVAVATNLFQCYEKLDFQSDETGSSNPPAPATSQCEPPVLFVFLAVRKATKFRFAYCAAKAGIIQTTPLRSWVALTHYDEDGRP